MNSGKLGKRSVKLTVLLIIELSVIAIFAGIYYNLRPDVSIVASDLGNWQSRFVDFDGSWHADETSVPDDMKDGGGWADLIYGPYIHLDKGVYSATIDYNCDLEQGYSIHSFENDNSMRILNTDLFTLDPNKTSEKIYFIVKNPIDDFEIRVRYNSMGSIRISNITISTSAYLPAIALMISVALFITFDLLVFLKRKEGDGARGRETWIDMCRGIGIILMMLGHRVKFPWFIYGFHMPFFFILSGYLFKVSDDIKQFAVKLFKRYLIPYYVLAFVNIAIDVILAYINKRPYPFAEELDQVISALACQAPVQGAPPLWFLPALAAALFIYDLIRKSVKTGFQEFVIIFIMGVFAVAYDARIPFNLNSAFMGVVLIYIGDLLKRNRLMLYQRTIKRRADTAFLYVVLFSVGYCCIRLNYTNNNNFHMEMYDSYYGNPYMFICGAVMISYLIFNLVHSICACENTLLRKMSGLFAYIGKHTIFIVAFDYLANYLYSSYITRYTKNTLWSANFIFSSLIIAVMYCLWRLMVSRMPDNPVKRL